MKIAYHYVFDAMADWETGYLTAELNSGRYFGKDTSRWEVRTFGQGKNPVRSLGGMKILPDLSVEEISLKEAGLLILPGGNTWLESCHDAVLKRVGEFLRGEIPVCAICGATAGLARAGYLNDRPHTSNDLGYLKAVCPNYFGEAYYRTTAVAVDGKLLTATGLAPLDFAYETLKLVQVFSSSTLEAWHKLNATHAPEHYRALLDSLK